MTPSWRRCRPISAFTWQQARGGLWRLGESRGRRGRQKLSPLPHYTVHPHVQVHGGGPGNVHRVFLGGGVRLQLWDLIRVFMFKCYDLGIANVFTCSFWALAICPDSYPALEVIFRTVAGLALCRKAWKNKYIPWKEPISQCSANCKQNMREHWGGGGANMHKIILLDSTVPATQSTGLYGPHKCLYQKLLLACSRNF